ncbi:SURF1 family protein [Yoonia sp. R2331]|uniref:SURF1 family protein n=1 Tax=Yoonia sp. R2331 TaxID=3237238 RepID=UPI0034E61353
MRKIIFPLLLTLAGCAVLIWLGVWQVNRLAWKEDILAGIDARMAGAPVPLPDTPTEKADEYRAVTAMGITGPQELHVLTSGTAAGTGYRVITSFDLGGRVVLLDQGLLPLEAKDTPAPEQAVTVTGNLLWPDDVNSSTPDPDLPKNIWFGRDLAAMADTLGTEPLLIVAAEMSPADPRTTLLPIDSANIKNDHWEYAVTWFGLAAVWAVMGAFLIRRTLQKD